MIPPMTDLRQLSRQFPHDGRVEAICLRPARNVRAVTVGSVMALADQGLEGDRSADRVATAPNRHKRQVTLLQWEHLPLVASWIGLERIDPVVLRRNLVIAGFNLVASRPLFADTPIRLAVGAEVVLVVTGPCEPCSKMEETLGRGAYNALRGHGGLTARIEVGGRIAVGDVVRVTA